MLKLTIDLEALFERIRRRRAREADLRARGALIFPRWRRRMAEFYDPKYQIPARQPTPGELLFEFVTAADRSPMACELRFHGESYGWEVQFFKRGEFLYSRGSFVLRELAVAWAEAERRALETALP